MALSTFTVVQAAPLSSFRTFSSTQTETVLFKYKSLFLLGYPQSAVTSVLFSVFMNLPIPGTSCKWNLKWFVLLHLTYFIQHIFMVQPWCRMYQNLVPLCDWIIFHCMYMPHFAYLFICSWTLGCFYLLNIENNASMNVDIQVSVWVPALQFFWLYIRLA